MDAVAQQVGYLLEQRDWEVEQPSASRKLWKIPATFRSVNGLMLSEATALAGVSLDVAVAELTAEPLRVMKIGFVLSGHTDVVPVDG